MLQHFVEVKVAYNCAISQELVLFSNKEILIGNQTIFCKEWFQKKIFLIQDLLQENSQFLTFPEFIQKYEVECNLLNYMQVVSAIPKHLSFLIKQNKYKSIKAPFSQKMHFNSLRIPS